MVCRNCYLLSNESTMGSEGFASGGSTRTSAADGSVSPRASPGFVQLASPSATASS